MWSLRCRGTLGAMSVLRRLLLLLLLLPLLEIYVLVKVGGMIGAWPTVGLVVAMAVLGLVLIRVQGVLTWQRAAAALLRGQLPAVELLEGVVVLVGGILFLIPGFVSDVLGLLCLVPPVRRAIIRWVLRRALIVPAPAGRAGANSGPRIIEGDFRRDDDPRFPR